MSSNYPPGVSGREYPIAGPDKEFDAERTCGQQDVTLRVLSEYGKDRIEKAVEALDTCTECRQPKFAHKMDCSQRSGPTSAIPAIRAFLSAALAEVEEVTVPECPFADDDVTVQFYGGVETWTCPVCGYDHETEVEPEDIDYDPRDDI